MNKYKGTIRTSSGAEHIMTVEANDFAGATRLLEQRGKLLYKPKMIGR